MFMLAENTFRESAKKVTFYGREQLVTNKDKSHEKNNTVVKVTTPSKDIVLLFGEPEKVTISISLPN